MGKGEGDEVTLELGQAKQQWEVLSVT